MLPPPGISGLGSASGMRARNIMNDATVRASSSALSHSPHSYADPSPPARRQSNPSPSETRVFEAYSEWAKESAVEGGRRGYADGGRGYAGVAAETGVNGHGGNREGDGDEDADELPPPIHAAAARNRAARLRNHFSIHTQVA